MPDDDRCCGTGTCIIDTQGRCWCGQVWNGEQMCRPALTDAIPDAITDATPDATPARGTSAPDQPAGTAP
ncbi:MAG: hypothetical protein ACK4OE_13535 [Acidovorax sp.]|uniref:hypothetical protein n=1 Tax=Acidovorax sp. TaxID=1872122 RepID=UPI003919B8A7